MEEAKKMLYQTMRTLDKRLTTQKWLHGVCAVNGTVATIVLALLVFVPPAVIAGTVLLGLSGATSVSRYIAGRVMTSKLERALEMDT